MHYIRNITHSKYEWVEFEFYNSLGSAASQMFLIKQR